MLIKQLHSIQFFQYHFVHLLNLRHKIYISNLAIDLCSVLNYVVDYSPVVFVVH